MIGFARTDTSIMATWWWTVDRWSLLALAALTGFGVLLTLAASPAVAERIGYDSYFFVRRQLIYLAPALAALAACSLMEPKGVRRIGVALFLVSVVLMVLTLVLGPEIKGARRWITIGGLSLQPSELMKPGFAIAVAWMMSAAKGADEFPGLIIAFGIYAIAVLLLVLQPDMGMVALITAMFFAQFFVAGMPLYWIGAGGAMAAGGAVLAYLYLPHVTSRVDRFLDPTAGDSYQVATGLEAFMNGGLLGRGPGEGTIKEVLPDAHSDFIFAVAGEELGLLACLLIVALFAFIVLRGISRSFDSQNLFVLLAVTGLITQFGLQALIHMASTLNLMPAKGMTLPFISYGGSSLIGVAITMGMVLALTRKRIGLRGM
ncbi:MAG: putative peptidoglycan glycosyltransferase FtsW [Alphaproteobacteria bacterium]|nr:putative peptidoglycan glycosyltransferase FtsW [Alphaproteobacteria bacterium]